MEESSLLDSMLSGSTAEEKLISAKNIIQSLESELIKSRSKCKTLESQLKKVQANNNLIQVNQNNTSSSFMLPSEFKKLWESATTDLCFNLFHQFLPSPNTFASLTRHLCTIISESVHSKLNSILLSLQSHLSLADTKPIKTHLLKLLQDSSSQAFPCNHSRISSLFLKTSKKSDQSALKSLILTEEFKLFVHTFHSISVYMALTEPVLTISFPSKPVIIKITNPEDFLLIDGFASINSNALIVFPEVTREGSRYLPCKASVLVLSEVENAKFLHQINEDLDSFESLQRTNTEPSSEDWKNETRSKLGKVRFASPRMKQKSILVDCVFCRIQGKCKFCKKVENNKKIKANEDFSPNLLQAAQGVNIDKFMKKDEKCKLM